MVRFEFVTIGKTSRDFSSLLWTKKDFQRTILALILLVIDLLPRNKPQIFNDFSKRRMLFLKSWIEVITQT